MALKARVFKGATEIDYTGLRWTRNGTVVVDEATLSFNPTDTVTVSSIISVKESDGSTNVFVGKIVNIQDTNQWTAKLYTNGYELHNRFVEKIYTNASPESIVQDVVNNYTNNLTFASTDTSGFTIPKYIARGYAADIIKEMMDLLRWRLRIDKSDNVYFEPVGNTDNGIVLTNGENFQITNWESDRTSMANQLRVEGGFQSFFKEQTLTGSGTTFALSKKPKGTFVAYSSGGTLEISTSLYVVSSEDKLITFTGSQTNPQVKYEYRLPIIVQTEDSDSITDHEEAYKEFKVPNVNTAADVRKVARELLGELASPTVLARGVIPFLDYDADVNQLVTVVDDQRSISQSLVIERIDWDAESNTTTLYFGAQTFDFLGWQQEVQEKIKQLLSAQRNNDEITYARFIRHDLDISLRNYDRVSIGHPYKNSFTVGHVTLGRIRAGIDSEADCSSNTNVGTWQGSGLSGAQYQYHRFIRANGNFNGSDNYITLGTRLTLTGNRTYAISLRPDSLSSTQSLASQVGNSAGDFYFTISDSSGHIRVRRYTGTANGYEQWTTTSLAASTSVWQTIAAVYDGSNITFYKVASGVTTSESPVKTTGNDTQASANLFCGRVASNYYDGGLDELKIFDSTLSQTQVENLHNDLFDAVHAKYSSCSLWWSMDNPQIGLRHHYAQWCKDSGPTGMVAKEYVVDTDFIDQTSESTATVSTSAHTVSFS